MSRIVADYDFFWAYKPCTKRQNLVVTEKDIGKCIGVPCQWYECCFLNIKTPFKIPSRPSRGRFAT
jgi:hypothetical protein